MVQSINIKVNSVIDATSLTGLTDYGQIMIGDNGFEFYHTWDKHKYIQILREEIDYVLISVMPKGKWIPRCAIQTKKNGIYTLSSKEPKEVLRVIKRYVDEDKMVQSLSFSGVMKRDIRSILKRK